MFIEFHISYASIYYEVKKEFRIKASQMKKNDFRTIEHSIRHGYKQKKLIDMPGFRFATSVLAEEGSGNPGNK